MNIEYKLMIILGILCIVGGVLVATILERMDIGVYMIFVGFGGVGVGIGLGCDNPLGIIEVKEDEKL